MGEHLIHVAVSKRGLKVSGIFDHFLHRKFRIAVRQHRNNPQQVSLTVGSLCPSTRKKIRVQFPYNLWHWNTGWRFSSIDVLPPHVINFSTYVLAKIWIPTRYIPNK